MYYDHYFPAIEGFLRKAFNNLQSPLQTAISTIDDCYRQIVPPGGMKIIDDTKEEGTTTTEETILEEEEEVEQSKWNFENALIFSFTVITTIGKKKQVLSLSINPFSGYGHIVPETTIGRVFVIVYGIIGVPLTLLTIADLGMFIAKVSCFLMILEEFLSGSPLSPSRNQQTVWMDCQGTNKLNCAQLSLWLIVRNIVVEKEFHLESRIRLWMEKIRVQREVRKKMRKMKRNTKKGKHLVWPTLQKTSSRKMDETLALCILFALYLLIGAHVLASYEPEMGFFEVRQSVLILMIPHRWGLLLQFRHSHNNRIGRFRSQEVNEYSVIDRQINSVLIISSLPSVISEWVLHWQQWQWR